ncbi:MAG: PEP-CTERM sorting domain-containing protein, partial [Deltaproteobacteria bacterium]|nr:PEP-CTERM sorting domain-containing protein [Deltaproteobacteria bacterium]
ARATQAVSIYGTNPTSGGAGTPSGGAPACFIHGAQQYQGMIHPFTTGFASVHTPVGSPNVITPQQEGYDIDLGGVDKISRTHFDWNQNWNQQLSTVTTTTATYMQYLYGVGRVVSMVRPRLIHTYATPLDLNTDPINTNWQVARLWAMTVFFVPEPAGMLMLGTGIVGLLGLSRMRRR